MKQTTKLRKRPWKSTLVAVLVIGGTAAFLIAFLAYAWNLTGDTSLSGHGIAALTIGIVLTMLIGVGLMGLVFFSSRRGYDDRLSRHEGEDPGGDGNNR